MDLVTKLLFSVILIILLYPVARALYSGLFLLISYSEYRSEVNKRKLTYLKDGMHADSLGHD